MTAASYLFSSPAAGALPVFWILAAVAVVLGLAAFIAIRRSGSAPFRRRARVLQSISWWGAALLGLSLAAGAIGLNFLTSRLWLYLILAITAVRFGRWLINLRSLGHDQVVERERRRKQSYFKRPRRKRGRSTRRR